jgi:hypothetical protein
MVVSGKYYARGKKTGRHPEESTCRLTKKVIRRSEECAC